ncbi:MAG: hypothetical protein ACLQVY_05190 [Limisphaerales bacterium]
MTRIIKLSVFRLNNRAVALGSDYSCRSVLANIRVVMDRIAPLGFEDEDGFHLGVEPPPDSSGERLSLRKLRPRKLLSFRSWRPSRQLAIALRPLRSAPAL